MFVLYAFCYAHTPAQNLSKWTLPRKADEKVKKDELKQKSGILDLLIGRPDITATTPDDPVRAREFLETQIASLTAKVDARDKELKELNSDNLQLNSRTLLNAIRT